MTFDKVNMLANLFEDEIRDENKIFQKYLIPVVESILITIYY
jgi:hypothetical protein